jgi:PST family polysaccharide transporter
MGLVMRRFDVRLRAVSIGEMWASVRDGWRVFVTGFLPNLYNDGTEIILQLITGNQSPVLGYYALAKKVIDVFNSVMYVIARAYFPLLTRATSYFNSFRNIILSWGLGLSALAFLAAPLVAGIASEDQWAGALPLIRILGISPFCIAVVLCYGRNFLLMHRLDHLYLWIVLIVSGIGLVLGVVLVPLFEQYGAATTLAVSRVIYAAMCFGLAMRLMRQGRFKRDGTALEDAPTAAGGTTPWVQG